MTPRPLLILPLIALPLVALANGQTTAPSTAPPTVPPTALLAEPAAPATLLALPGDLEYGAFLAQECAICHLPLGAQPAAGAGTAGAIPVIAGRPAAELVQALYAYRAGHRANPVMQTIAGTLDDEMIAALAAHFAAQTP